MWGGIYAVLFSIATITSAENPVRNGFPKINTQPYEKITFSKVEFQDKIVGSELQYSHYFDRKYGPIQPGYSISITDKAGLWFGSGFIKKVKLNDKFNLNFDFFPGVYFQNNEVDLGGWLMFRSGIELEYQLRNIWNISIAYDHRSSGDIWEYNPGLETIKFSVSRYITPSWKF
jgi:hypothetical protein